MSELSHTPLPWEVDEGRPAVFSSEEGILVAVCFGVTRHAVDPPHDESPANAELIVRAVNCHDELVEACQAALDDLPMLPEEQPGFTGPSWTAQRQLRAKLEAAIAAATGR